MNCDNGAFQKKGLFDNGQLVLSKLKMSDTTAYKFYTGDLVTYNSNSWMLKCGECFEKKKKDYLLT